MPAGTECQCPRWAEAAQPKVVLEEEVAVVVVAGEAVEEVAAAVERAVKVPAARCD